MKLLTCPINGPRPLQEFVFGGEVRPMPNPDTSSDKQWADYVFNRSGEPGISKEWWYHAASAHQLRTQPQSSTSCLLLILEDHVLLDLSVDRQQPIAVHVGNVGG